MDKKERIAKVIARAGVCSRRDAEKLIAEGLVTLNGKQVKEPGTTVTLADHIRVRGKTVTAPEEARLWLYHKPSGLVTTHRDTDGRGTVFDNLPTGLPRVVSVGRLDLNTEGLLLLTNDGGLARHMELPATGWKRRYRARIYGPLTDAAMASLAKGVTVEGVKYGPVLVDPETAQAEPTRLAGNRNHWAMITLTEGKNREIRKVLEHVDCKVSRLIRVAYGPFQLGHLKPREVKEVPQKMLKEQLGKDWEK